MLEKSWLCQPCDLYTCLGARLFEHLKLTNNILKEILSFTGSQWSLFSSGVLSFIYTRNNIGLKYIILLTECPGILLNITWSQWRHTLFFNIIFIANFIYLHYHTHTHPHTYTHTYTHIHTHIHTHTYTHMSISTKRTSICRQSISMICSIGSSPIPFHTLRCMLSTVSSLLHQIPLCRWFPESMLKLDRLSDWMVYDVYPILKLLWAEVDVNVLLDQDIWRSYY